MNTVDSPDKKLEMSDVDSLLKREAPQMDYPPPYETHSTEGHSSMPTLDRPMPTIMVQPQTVPSAVTNIHMVPGTQMHGFQNVGPKSMSTYCQNCQLGIKTKTKTTHKCCTHCCCLFLFITMILGPCCCVPYCIASPATVEHTCPNCSAHIGTYYG